MRHAEVAEAPRKAGGDLLPAGGEQACAEDVLRAVLRVGIYGRKCGSIKILRSHDHDRDSQNGHQHKKPLEKVGPADGLEAAEERVDNNDGSKDQHSR